MAKATVLELAECNTRISLVVVPELNLYIITDARGFGPNWIQVTHHQKVFSATLLMGTDPDDTVTSIARFLANVVVKKQLASSKDEVSIADEMKLVFNISLRDKDPKNLRQIKEAFEKLLLDP